MRPALSVVYVNHNTTDLLVESIRTVRAHAEIPLEIIVVDNGSTSPRRALEGLGSVTLIEQANRGFGAANNRGVREARGEVVLLLNPDALLTQDTHVGAVVDYFRRDCGVGAILPCLTDETGRVQPTQVAYDPSLTRLLLDKPVKLLLALRRDSPLMLRLAARVNLDFAKLDAARPVDVAVAAALFVRRETYEAVNGFDERFFMFYEDSDLCRRIRESGKSVEFHPEWQVIHLWGRSIASTRERKRLYFQGQDTYFRIHGGVARRIAVRVLRASYVLSKRLARKW
jgi:GT2 family glycosyltransferase